MEKINLGRGKRLWAAIYSVTLIGILIASGLEVGQFFEVLKISIIPLGTIVAALLGLDAQFNKRM